MPVRLALVLILSLAGAPAFPQEYSRDSLGGDWSAELRKFWGSTDRLGGRSWRGLRAEDIPGVPLPDAPRSCQEIRDRRPLENFAELAIDAGPEALVDPEPIIRCVVMGEEWSADQRALLERIETLGVSVGHLWLGSHVVVRGDSGDVHADWRRRGSRSRISSHYRGVDSQQFEVSFKRHALLVGKNGSGDTWFQMENHAGRTVTGKPGHVVDFFRLTLSGRNIGPLGSSNRTEQSPLVVPYRL